MNKKQLTVAESACIITGYGIGGGVMAMPYLAQKNGVVVSLLILAAAFGASFVLHVMIAELAVKSGGGSQIIEVFSRYLFQGKYQKVLTAGFFVIMALVPVSYTHLLLLMAKELLKTQERLLESKDKQQAGGNGGGDLE